MKTKLVKEEEKKKRRRRNLGEERTEQPTQEKKKRKKKKNRTANPREDRKKKKSQKVVKSCGWVLFVGPLCMLNYNIVIELWVMKTENSQNMFSASITYNSKIRVLSDGNRVMTSQTTFLLWVSPFLSYELWKLRYELWKLLNQTPPKPLWVYWF